LIVAVTGGAGQLGTVVLKRLLAERAVKEVRCLDVRPPLVVSSKLRSVEIDIRDPRIGDSLAGCDALVHLAFVVIARLPRAEFESINVGGSTNVFRAALAAGVRQIVYSTSVAAYGVVPGHPRPIVETTPRRYQPEFPYAATKWQVEQLLDELEREQPDLRAVRFRPGILIGAAMENPLGQALGRRLMFDSGGQPLPLVWDEDVADAVFLALKKRAHGAFNLVADESRTAAELARAGGLRLIRVPRALAGPLIRCSSLLGPPVDPAWGRILHVPMIASADKAHRELGWTPKCPTAIDVIRHFVAVTSAGLDPRLRLFFRLVALASQRPAPEEARHLRARVHLVLTGPGGGERGIVLDEGRLTIGPHPPRPPTVTVTMKATTMLDLLAGATDFGAAQLTGRVRVEGEALAAWVVQGMVTSFRQRAQAPGAAGFIPRQLARWFGLRQKQGAAT
jgi:nucleoside-diphosphate-sugar epimerase/putative sterol carrier protein